MGPKTDQNGTKNGPKSKTNLDIEKEALQDRLGVVLGRSWIIFGRPLGSFLLIFHWFFKAFRENSLFSKNVASRAILDRSWADFGPTWAAKWVRNGTPNGPKFDEKKHVEIE